MGGGCVQTTFGGPDEVTFLSHQDVPSPVRHKRRKSPRAVRGKRKSVEVEVCVIVCVCVC